MINRASAIVLVHQFTHDVLEQEAWYKRIRPQLKAVVLYGSVAKGLNRADSDVDVSLILPLAAEEKYTVSEYFYDYKNETINIVLRSIERLREIAKDGSDTFQKEVFRECELLTDTDGEVGDLLESIATIE